MPDQEVIEEEAPEEEFPEDSFDEEIEVDDETIESELLDLDAENQPAPDDDDADTADEEEEGAGEPEGEAEALDELEAEELDMLTDDETSETLVVDEAAEMRQIRREELAMDRKGADEATEGEFVCSNCFLVLKTSQLADGRRKICRDCAA